MHMNWSKIVIKKEKEKDILFVCVYILYVQSTLSNLYIYNSQAPKKKTDLIMYSAFIRKTCFMYLVNNC